MVPLPSILGTAVVLRSTYDSTTHRYVSTAGDGAGTRDQGAPRRLPDVTCVHLRVSKSAPATLPAATSLTSPARLTSDRQSATPREHAMAGSHHLSHSTSPARSLPCQLTGRPFASTSAYRWKGSGRREARGEYRSRLSLKAGLTQGCRLTW